jgi:hypothetical protein
MKSGDLVVFGGKRWWVYDFKGEELILLPEENLDYEQELLKLDGAIQVNKMRVKLYEAPE